MNIRCPHCHNPIDLVDSDPLVEIQCPSCGSSFSLVTGDTTAAFRSGIRRLAHFEMVRELGIGKFGSVWLAHDTELDRTVAIKIPRKGALDAEETALFLRDARAAAQLKHPYIVGVHEVGREDDTVYIVSDYVEGVNLKERLSGGRISYRETAELTSNVAGALEHAHQVGVVHRDLKPSNIMLDDKGDPHVIDFGLAKREAGEITMTVDGQVLGTPAYMSPEQAAGKGHDADARSDVYSLGVILYELLTGELPFRGEKQMIIWQIQHDEPSRPRRLNAKIPRDLETITVKCLEKDPAKRYQTALALADDLKRWLDGRPIIARPIGRISRGLRWCKRNRAVATLSASILTLMAAVAAGSIFAAIWINEERRQAVAARDYAAATAIEAEQQREKAEENFRSALAAVDDYLTKVSESKLIDVSGLQPLRRELLESALNYYQGFIKDHHDDPQVRYELAMAYARIGKISKLVGSYPAARDAYERAIKSLEELVRQQPMNTKIRDALGHSCDEVASVYSATGHPREYIAMIQKAIEIQEFLVQANPQIVSFRDELMRRYGNLAFLMERKKRLADAAELNLKAVAVNERLARDYPGEQGYENRAATLSVNLARIFDQMGRSEEAAALRDTAAESYLRQLQQVGGGLESQRERAQIYRNLGSVQSDAQRLDEAAVSYGKAIELCEKLLRENPNSVEIQIVLAQYTGLFARMQIRRDKLDEGRRLMDRQLAISEKLARANPSVASYQRFVEECSSDLLILQVVANSAEPTEQRVEAAQAAVRRRSADAYNQLALGGAFYRAGDFDEAIKPLRATVSMAQIGVALGQVPQQFADEYKALGLLFLAMAHQQLGDDAKGWAELTDAIRLIEKTPPQYSSGLANHLRRETETLIDGQPTDKPNSE